MADIAEYFALAKLKPELFVNPPGAIFTILLEPDDIARVESEMKARLQREGLPVEWGTVGVAYRDQYMTLLRDAVRFPDGSLGTYFRFVEWGQGVPGVIVLPVYRGRVMLERHFRHATRQWHLELPRGFGAAGLSSEENARRELVEELGAVVSRLVSLGTVYPDAGASTEHDALFYAEVESYSQPDATEGISEILLVQLDEFERLIRENELADGFSLMAFARAKACGLI